MSLLFLVAIILPLICHNSTCHVLCHDVGTESHHPVVLCNYICISVMSTCISLCQYASHHVILRHVSRPVT